MHKANVKSAHSQRKLQFVPVSDPINDKVYIITIFLTNHILNSLTTKFNVTRAEVKIATMLAQNGTYSSFS